MHDYLSILDYLVANRLSVSYVYTSNVLIVWEINYLCMMNFISRDFSKLSLVI